MYPYKKYKCPHVRHNYDRYSTGNCLYGSGINFLKSRPITRFSDNIYNYALQTI